MTKSSEIINIAINEINESSDDGILIVNDPKTLLLSEGSDVDSLTLVNLLITIERVAEEQTGKTITLVDESTLEAEKSPFSNIESLTLYLTSLISRNN